MTDASPPGVSQAASSDEWLDLLDQVLLGLDHALNNRLGALRAYAELLRDDGWRASPAATESIQTELARLEETTSIVRKLARPRQPLMTGLMLEEVMTDVVRIQSMLHDVRDTPIDFAPAAPLEPVWSEQTTLIRLLLLALYGLRRAARARGASARVAMSSDEEWTRIAFGGAPGTAPAVTDHMSSLATTIGAHWRTTEGSSELRLPTLKARRDASRGPAR